MDKNGFRRFRSGSVTVVDFHRTRADCMLAPAVSHETPARASGATRVGCCCFCARCTRLGGAKACVVAKTVHSTRSGGRMALLQMSWCGACLWRLWLSARTDGMARPNVSTRSVWLLRAVISTSEVPGAECHSMPQPMTASSCSPDRHQFLVFQPSRLHLDTSVSRMRCNKT